MFQSLKGGLIGGIVLLQSKTQNSIDTILNSIVTVLNSIVTVLNSIVTVLKIAHLSEKLEVTGLRYFHNSCLQCNKAVRLMPRCSCYNIYEAAKITA